MDEPLTPNTGRMIDYWLGGTHHFAADIRAADAFAAGASPGPAVVYRMLRGFIGRAARHVASEGIGRFVVFGAGIPTRGNVHEAVPHARVVYTDFDAVNVRLGSEILANHSSATYLHCDAADLSTLDSDAARRFLGEGPFGLVFVGLSALLDDARLARALASLHAWAPSGSRLIFDFDGEALAGAAESLELARASFGASESPLHLRGPAAFERLVAPWRIEPPGMVPVALWRPDSAPPPYDADRVFMYGGVAHQ
jgi:hypothetical protein